MKNNETKSLGVTSLGSSENFFFKFLGCFNHQTSRKLKYN